MNWFLYLFGLRREVEALLAEMLAAAGEPAQKRGIWPRPSRGVQLYNAGRIAEATAVFRAVLAAFGEPQYRSGCDLGPAGSLLPGRRPPGFSCPYLRVALAVLEHLEPTDDVKRRRSVCLTDLADALVAQGRYAEARQVFADGLEIDEDLGDLRGQGVTLGQLGTLALEEGNLNEAEESLPRRAGAVSATPGTGQRKQWRGINWAGSSRKPSGGTRPSDTTGNRRASKNSKATWRVRPDPGASWLL